MNFLDQLCAYAYSNTLHFLCASAILIFAVLFFIESYVTIPFTIWRSNRKSKLDTKLPVR